MRLETRDLWLETRFSWPKTRVSWLETRNSMKSKPCGTCPPMATLLWESSVFFTATNYTDLVIKFSSKTYPYGLRINLPMCLNWVYLMNNNPAQFLFSYPFRKVYNHLFQGSQTRLRMWAALETRNTFCGTRYLSPCPTLIITNFLYLSLTQSLTHSVFAWTTSAYVSGRMDVYYVLKTGLHL